MMSLWDALRMNMMISYQELVRTFLSKERHCVEFSELTSDEVTALIGVMNHLRAVVSLFPKRLAMPN
ncbi:DUF5347 family protein, partial [Klebsiella pneumoniae]|nr:hypothetical protein [Klebsiella pneumoniae]